MRTQIAVVLSALAAGLPAARSLAVESGAFSLAAGESRDFHIGSTYRSLRICNDFASAGPLTAWTGHHLPQVLRPGVCADDSGDHIVLRNGSAGRVEGTFRSLPSRPGSDGPDGYEWEFHF
jgi:hypothetical protein